MHEVERNILEQLAVTPAARYGALKPSDIEGNLFSYHLKSLVKKGLIAAVKGSYELTSKGKGFLDRLSSKLHDVRVQPKIVTLIVLKEKGKYLLYRRNRTPFRGLVGFPYGKIHMEERIEESAHRELLEKVGVKAKLRHRGEVYLAVYDDTELVTHMLCHVFVGTKRTGELLGQPSIGECFWAAYDSIDPTELMPGVRQIVSLVEKSRQPFFAEYFLSAKIDKEGGGNA